MTTQASFAACGTPSCTGRERTPISVSPSTDLKSFSVMMPCAAMLYSSASASDRAPGIAPPAITAAPVIQANPSYDKPQAALPHQPLFFSRSGGAL